MSKKIIEAQIINNTEIASNIYRITVECDASITEADPGQFINVYLNDKSLLLPRPISICRAEKGRIALVYRVVGKGTNELSAYQSGDSLRISTPLGRGYDLDKVFRTLEESRSGSETIVLVAGGLGVPPMVELAKRIRKRIGEDRNVNLIAALGFQNETFLIEDMSSFCDDIHIATARRT